MPIIFLLLDCRNNIFFYALFLVNKIEITMFKKSRYGKSFFDAIL